VEGSGGQSSAVLAEPALVAGLDDAAEVGLAVEPAAVILASTNTPGHSPYARLVVMIPKSASRGG